jgi:uncharacterized protein YciI
MPLLVVVNEQGPAWVDGRPMREQAGWSEHAAFMNTLEAEGWVAVGGPLRGGSKHRTLLVVRGADEPSVRQRLGEDPWMRSGTLRLVSIETWEVLLGRLD